MCVGCLVHDLEYKGEKLVLVFVVFLLVKLSGEVGEERNAQFVPTVDLDETLEQPRYLPVSFQPRGKVQGCGGSTDF